jgi:hypothetical protein
MWGRAIPEGSTNSGFSDRLLLALQPFLPQSAQTPIRVMVPSTTGSQELQKPRKLQGLLPFGDGRGLVAIIIIIGRARNGILLQQSRISFWDEPRLQAVSLSPNRRGLILRVQAADLAPLAKALPEYSRLGSAKFISLLESSQMAYLWALGIACGLGLIWLCFYVWRLKRLSRAAEAEVLRQFSDFEEEPHPRSNH